MPTEEQKKRVARFYQTYAGDGETVKAQRVIDTWYIFGSELATLRIFARCYTNKNAHHGFSEATGNYYFSFDVA